jgi:ATP-dependent Clp protease adaptor protein ClpS
MISPVLEPQISDGDGLGQGRWMVVIYNNDHNSMEEVMSVLMHATGCDAEEAYIEMWEAHTYGKAPVHFADQEECGRVAAIIGSIGLTTTVCREWED